MVFIYDLYYLDLSCFHKDFLFFPVIQQDLDFIISTLVFGSVPISLFAFFFSTYIPSYLSWLYNTAVALSVFKVELNFPIYQSYFYFF